MGPNAITGQWYRSVEEEDGEKVVYRGQSFDFPRARRPRPSLRLDEDGSAGFGAPGPADAAEITPGRWQLAGDVLQLSRAGEVETFHVERLDDEVLILTKR